MCLDEGYSGWGRRFPIGSQGDKVRKGRGRIGCLTDLESVIVIPRDFFFFAPLRAGSNYMSMTHSISCSNSSSQDPGPCSSLRVHVVQHSTNYCARVADVTSYGEVNREVSQ